SKLLQFTPSKGRAGTCIFETNKGMGWRQQNGWGHFPYLQRWARCRIFNRLGGIGNAQCIRERRGAAVRRGCCADCPGIAPAVARGAAPDAYCGNSPGLAEE